MKSVARVLRALNVDDAYDEECIVMKNARNEPERIIKRERLKPAEVYKYDGSRRYGAQGCCRSCGMGLPKPSNQPHFCLSPTTVTHVTHVTGPRLDLWIFSFICICFFFFFFRPSSFFLSFFSKSGEDSASEEMPTDRFRIRRWSSIFIPCS